MSTEAQKRFASFVELFTGVFSRRVHASPRKYVPVVKSDAADLNIDYIEFLAAGTVTLHLQDDADGVTHARAVAPGDTFAGSIKRVYATDTTLTNEQMRGFRF